MEPVYLPAWAAFILWVVLQILGAKINLTGGTAYFAHLGGAAAGIIAAIIYKTKTAQAVPVPDLAQTLNRRKNQA